MCNKNEYLNIIEKMDKGWKESIEINRELLEVIQRQKNAILLIVTTVIRDWAICFKDVKPSEIEFENLLNKIINAVIEYEK